jgi:SAM-dependent methyltransferase
MSQQHAWEQEYQNPKLVTKKEEPQSDVLRFLKWLKKEQDTPIQGLSILDLGSGTGRNANYLATLGNKVTGIEIAPTAVKLARTRAKALGVEVPYLTQSMGDAFPFKNETFDLLLDITSSNALTEEERSIYLAESHRVLKTGGFFFVKGLCKDGDKNAKNLIKKNPGPEKDTYTIPEMGLTERVFTEADFRALYEPYFTIISLTKKTNYSRFNNQSYKRNFWLAYLQKK